MNSFYFVKNVIENNGIFAKNLHFKARYSADSSAEYSAVFGRIFGIGRYQFLPYRSYTNYDILDIVGFF